MVSKQKLDLSEKTFIETPLSDYSLIADPILNKGMSFSEQERFDFNLFGLLPPHFSTIEEQSERSYEAFKDKSTDIEKYIYLHDLQDSNETLFYSLLTNHLTEMMPIVYTPIVGLGCQQFSEIYRRPRGLFIAYPYKDMIDQILSNPRFDGVEVIVVSDGERILGLGDQGAGGMGIPIGKLSLYSGCAGVHPAKTLPILLDTGTDNLDRINDPLYIGWKHERIRGKEYDDFIEAFVTAVKKRFPHVLLQWEDFAKRNANPILQKYRDQLCTFNDDIQGTAAIATGTLFAALKISGTELQNHKIAVFGGGSAGCGISKLLVKAMVHEGLTEKEARSRFFIIDKDGLLLEGAKDLMDFQKPFCQSRDIIADWKYSDENNITLLDVVKNIHPTVLVGVSGQASAFSEEIVKEIAAHVERPVIFPLSNPTSCSEATPVDLIKWTNNKVILGTGSPFPSIERNGVLTRIDQTNNAYIFPGMGLGLIAVRATRVTEQMFMLAAKALASCSPALKDPNGNLLPPLDDIRNISFKVALAVAKEAVAADLSPFKNPADVEKLVRDKVWEPCYLPYKKSK